MFIIIISYFLYIYLFFIPCPFLGNWILSIAQMSVSHLLHVKCLSVEPERNRSVIDIERCYSEH